MNFKTIAPLAPVLIVAALAFGTLAPHAQTASQKIGFVDVQQVLTAHPSNATIVALRTKGQTELDGMQKQIKDLQAKGTAATPAEKDQLNQLVTTIQARAKALDDQLTKAVAPIETAVDTAVSAAAKAQGFSVVMDAGPARANGLVIYADPATDLTPAIVTAVKGAKK